MPRPKPKIHCKECDGWGIVPNERNLPWPLSMHIEHPSRGTSRGKREHIVEQILYHDPPCNMQNKGHHESCACPRADGPELRRWLLKHKMFTKCEACKGESRLRMHVAVERALKKAETVNG